MRQVEREDGESPLLASRSSMERQGLINRGTIEAGGTRQGNG